MSYSLVDIDHVVVEEQEDNAKIIIAFSGSLISPSVGLQPLPALPWTLR